MSGNTVDITTGNDLTVKGSNVVGTGDVNLTAGNNINITSAKENSQSENYTHTETSGIFSGGGLSLTIGSQSQKLDTTNQTVAQVASTVGSTNGQVNISANKDTNITGSDIIGAKGINVTAQNITIDAATNTSHTDQTYEFHQSGLTVSIGNTAINQLTSAAGDLRRSANVNDSRLQTLYDYKAASETVQGIKDLTNGVPVLGKDGKALVDSKGNIVKEGLQITVSIGSSSQKSETVVDETWAQGSTLTSSGDINLTATGSGAKDTIGKAIDGNLNIIASTVTGQNVDLSAVKDVNLQSAANTSQSNTTSSSSSFGVGVQMSSGSAPGFFVNGSKASDNGNEDIATHTNTVVTAQDTLTITSGSDTNIVGAQANGNTVKMVVGDNLNIASQQDVDNYTERSSSAGGTIGIGMPSIVSASKGKTDSTYASVTGQSGIFAGNGGFNINVGGNTDLTGAVIASTATPDKNMLSTDTLTFSNIDNSAQYSSSSIGVNLNTSKDAEKKDQGLTPNIGVTASGNADSTTKSAVSPGTIEVRSNPNADLGGLSRDPSGTLNALGKIFDKKTVQEQQELAGLFGELAFEEVHKLSVANGWAEGSPQKIALHALVGGIMSDLGGGGFTSGAVGAGFNEAIQGELSKIKDPALHQWASAIVGAAAAKLVGGNAQTGASVAASGTKNNLLAYFLTNTKDALKQALQAKNGTEPTDQQVTDLNAQISTALNTTFPDGRPTIDGEAAVIRGVLQQNGIPSDSIDNFINVYTSQASVAVQQYNTAQLNLADIRTTALMNSIADNIKGTIALAYLTTPDGQKKLVAALLNDPTLPLTIGQNACNDLKNWYNNMQGNNGDNAQAQAQGQLLGQVLTAYVTKKGIDALGELGVAAEEFELPKVVVTADRIPSKAVFSNGRATIEVLEANPKVFSGKSADEIAQMLRDAGYDVTVEASKKSSSGAQIIKINNPGEGKNITQVQVSPGGGRHGADPYVKISTNDQGIIKIVDGNGSLYKTDGKETAKIIFTGGK